MIEKEISFREGEMSMHPTISLENQLLATKFFVPTSLGPLVARPRLNALLNKSLKHPLTLVSAPAGFGKTTLLSTWVHSLKSSQYLVAWLSLDEEDNDPQLFWMYVLAALQRQQPEGFGSLLQSLQSSQAPHLKAVLTALINLLLENDQQVMLILDDYHIITTPEIHTSLLYLVQHIPPQLHVMIATRRDPPMQLAQWRAREQVLEVRAQQLRCTIEETKKFFQEVMGVQLPEKVIEEVMDRTEGWLVGLQLLGFSLPGHDDPVALLKEMRGDQRYILDYLTEEVLRRQPQEVQTFLLCTSILDQLSASLCDAVLERHGSQQMLQQLEQANLFVVSLDRRRQWYRYHALFAQALHYRLEQTHSDLVPILHTRASHWYAQQHQTTAAILHAFQAHEWHWVADLLEQAYPLLISFTWGANRYALVQFLRWIEQLPAEILACRPHFCLACVHLLWTITPHALLSMWLDLAEATLRASLKEPMLAQENLFSQGEQEQRDLLGKVLTLRTFLQGFQEDGQAALAFGGQALAYLPPKNVAFRAIVTIGKAIAYYNSSANDAMAAIENGYQATQLAQEAGQIAVVCAMMATTALFLVGAGHLHEAEQLIQQALLLQTPSSSPQLPEMGWIMFCRAEILRERNDLASAHSLAREAISLCEQSVSLASLPLLCWGYAILIRVSLSCSDWKAACAFLQQAEQVGISMNQQVYQYYHSCFTTVDQVRLWLACGEQDRATHWAQEQEMEGPLLTPFARERQEVAQARVLFAKDQPTAAIQRLEPALQRATAGQRWGHVIEIRLLQALAHQKLHEESQALAALSEAVRLGEPEGYIRCFVEEGETIAVLLSKLWKEKRKAGPTAYLDCVLAAFPMRNQAPPSSSKRTAKQTLAQPLLEPLSEREMQVLQLMAEGSSNQEIAQELVIAIDTVKRHVSHILAKLGVQNRVQAVKQAHKLSLLKRDAH